MWMFLATWEAPYKDFMIQIHLLYGYSPWRRESSWISGFLEMRWRWLSEGTYLNKKMAFSLKSRCHLIFEVMSTYKVGIYLGDPFVFYLLLVRDQRKIIFIIFSREVYKFTSYYPYVCIYL